MSTDGTVVGHLTMCLPCRTRWLPPVTGITLFNLNVSGVSQIYSRSIVVVPLYLDSCEPARDASEDYPTSVRYALYRLVALAIWHPPSQNPTYSG